MKSALKTASQTPSSVARRWGLMLTLLLGVGLLIIWLEPALPSRASAGIARPLTYESPIGNPLLTLRKQANLSAVKAGDLLEYQIGYANTQSGGQAFNVRLYDFLPAGVQLVSTSIPAQSAANNVLLFTAPTVGPGTSYTTITVQVRVLPGQETLYNHALVTADCLDPATVALATDVLPATDKLTLALQGNAAVLSGRRIVYHLRATNTSEVIFNNLTLWDILPAGVTLESASETPVDGAPPLKWTLPNLSPNSSWEVVVTATAPSAVGVITNVALLQAPSHVDVRQTWATQVISEGVILDVQKSGPAEVYPGDTLHYTLFYQNIGNATANQAVLTDTFPAGIVVDAADTPATSVSGNQWVWRFPTLDAEVSGTLHITATVNVSTRGTLLNEADFTAPGAWASHDEQETIVRLRKLYLPLVLRKKN